MQKVLEKLLTYKVAILFYAYSLVIDNFMKENIMKNTIIKLVIIVSFLCPISAVNFSEDISQIIYENCTECHREGEIGGFLPLTNFNEVYDNRNWISAAISIPDDYRHGQPMMPPWQPDREYSNLVGERFLSDSQIQLFLDWIDVGADQGDSSLEYPMPEFPEGSAIGTPDIVLTMEESTQIQGNYEDYYRCFVFDLNSDEDIYYSAIEVRPGNNEAVHHTVIVAVPPGSADELDAADDQYGYECFGGFGVTQMTDLLGGYAPGTKPNKWNNGLAQKIPAGWDLIAQMHYAPVLEDMEDLTEINIFTLENDLVEREIQSFTMIDPTIFLPPHQITEVHNTQYVSGDISVVSFFPHSHLLGDSWEVYAVSASNDTIPFIRINDWDFDWQNYYYPEYMLHVPSGSTIHAKAVYDNTANNPNNPNNPPEYVWWGDGTTDEMFFLPILYVPYQDGDEFLPLGEVESAFGDVNYDGEVNIIDVVLIVNYILGPGNLSDDQIILSDYNMDGSVDILDIVDIINYILIL